MVGFRTEVDDRNEKLGFRIREAQTRHIPVEIVVGDGEVEKNSVNIRRFGHTESISLSLDDAIKTLLKEVNDKEYSK